MLGLQTMNKKRSMIVGGDKNLPCRFTIRSILSVECNANSLKSAPSHTRLAMARLPPTDSSSCALRVDGAQRTPSATQQSKKQQPISGYVLRGCRGGPSLRAALFKLRRLCVMTLHGCTHRRWCRGVVVVPRLADPPHVLDDTYRVLFQITCVCRGSE